MAVGDSHMSPEEIEQRLDRIDQIMHPGGGELTVNTPGAAAIVDAALADLAPLNWPVQHASWEGRRDLERRYNRASLDAEHIRLLLRGVQARREAEQQRAQDELELRDVECELRELANRRSVLLGDYNRAADVAVRTEIRLQGFNIMREVAEKEARKLELELRLGVVSVETGWNEEARIGRMSRRAAKGIAECTRQWREAS
ncbi:hypothetical protein [Gordonia otitidis]|uniref:Uncharacterized protein n=1 Tax=Gordonia otitidis (strain DSM 44809 / CCUG 52243 / JCM 12355 / NBRC 100426 / IFM 10032) TaxID=1108044 RepID=H5TRP7_GORO1|nr:hypothetical protein [Gordonia otitidis]GAB36155.1 hypothetical protein GOOTI_202_00110 [Gordonia otitidis NBRC 100426]